MKRVNYLNNRDILKEIHLSKNTYCTFKHPKYDHQYDAIVYDVTEIDGDVINLAISNRIARLAREGTIIENEDILKTDLIFRVMTWEHIPLAEPKTPKQKKSKKIDILEEFSEINDSIEYSDINGLSIGLIDDIMLDDTILGEIDPDNPVVTDKTHIKVNFPPFFHYRFNELDELEIIGKSHWIGGLIKGKFSKTHGQMTNNLALMIMKLTERYGSRSNWRGYSYLDEMQGQGLMQLSQVALQFNEAKSANPFSYFSCILQNSFTRVLNIEKRNQNVRDELLEKAGYNPSFARQGQSNIDHLD